MKSLQDIQKIVAKFNVKPGPEMRSKVLDEALEIQRNQNQQSISDTKLNIWRIIMKSPITKLATAAVVVIACLIGLSFWRTTGSGIALADVLARIEKANAFGSSRQWSESEKITGEDPNKPPYVDDARTYLISQEYGLKFKEQPKEQPDPNGGESTFLEEYWLLQKKTKISISHKKKEYTREEFEDDWLERQLEWPWANDPRVLVKEILGCKYESMGRATIDGIEVEGFQTTDPNWVGNAPNIRQVDVKMWVDVKTWLPVRYEEAYVYFEEKRQRFEHTHSVMHDFRWDVVVDAAEFEPPVIPDDYTGTVVKWPSINEENAIQGLKLWVELLGNYPKSIMDMIVLRDFTALRSAFEKSETPAAMRLKEELKGLSQSDKTNRLRVAMLPMQCLNKFRIKLGGDKKDPAYYWKIVTPKDTDKVLMRWKVSDNEYRVIYGDLHAETVTPDKLAELEKALPK